MALTDKLKAIADAIRYVEDKTYPGGSSGESMTLSQMPDKIRGIANFEPLPELTPEYAGFIEATGTAWSGNSTNININVKTIDVLCDNVEYGDVPEAIIKEGKQDLDEFSVYVRSSEFGDATAADVVAGKTFTSAAGLKVVGTRS